jgi:hypothetical protein
VNVRLLLLALAASSCPSVVTRVPCQSNENCPTTTWCNAECLCTPLAEGLASQPSQCVSRDDGGPAPVDAGAATDGGPGVDAGASGFQVEALLKPLAPRAGDVAASVALSGDGTVLIQGAGGRTSDSGLEAAGQLLVWRRTQSTWQLSQVLEAAPPRLRERAGTTVAISRDGSTIAAIAISATNPGGFLGAVDFFTRQPDGQYQHTFRYQSPAPRPPLSPTLAAQAFHSVALSDTGETVALGDADDCTSGSGVLPSQTGSSNPTCLRTGGVSILGRSGEVWRLQAFIKPEPTAPADARFGEAVALSGDGTLLAVGASNFPRALRSGSVSLFFRRSGAWELGPRLSNEDRGTDFGEAIALSDDGQTLAVSAPTSDSPDDGGIPTGQGLVFVYARQGISFLRNGLLRPAISQRNDRFGHALDLSGDGTLLAVGAVGDFSGTGDPADDSVVGAGAVHLYRWSGTAWRPEQFLTAPVQLPEARLGHRVSVAADGRSLAAGAVGHSSGVGGVNPPIMGNAPTAGAAFVFRAP